MAKGVRRRRVRWTRGFFVKNRDGLFLLDPRMPIAWSERRGLLFLTRKEAERLVAECFVGPRTARSLGVRIVPV